MGSLRLFADWLQMWQLRRDFLAFPVSSSSYQVVIRYLAPGRTRGGAVLLLTAVRRKRCRRFVCLLGFI